MKIGIVGPSYKMSSLPFDAQRTINAYPVKDNKGGRDVVALYGTDGLKSVANLGFLACRGEFRTTAGRLYVVSGSTLFEVSADYSYVSRGSLLGTYSNCSFDENGLQLAICDGTRLYILDYETNTFTVVPTTVLPPVTSVTFINGFFVATALNSEKFYVSSPYDGLTWSALDYASAESSPDTLKKAINSAGFLWLIGDYSVEVWTGSNSVEFEFERLSGNKIEVGIAAPDTAISIINTLIWLGRDKYGAIGVFAANNFSPQRISTEPIETKITQSGDLSQCYAYAYAKNGHIFYVLSGGNLETSFVYDTTTEEWHERAYTEEDGTLSQHIARSVVPFGQKMIACSRKDGTLYEMSDDYLDDDGNPIILRRVTTHVFQESQIFRTGKLRVGFQMGVGTDNGQGQNPEAMLRISKDGAQTWTDCGLCPIGAEGEYQGIAEWRRLGVARQMTFEISVSDPVKRAIIGGWLA